MRREIQILGHTPFARELRGALAGASAPSGAAASSVIVACHWDDLGALRALDQQAQHAQSSWILIEAGEEGSVLVGPMLGAGGSGCFACFTARRRSNGAKGCRPVEEAASGMAARIAAAVRSWIDGEGASGAAQIELFPDGGARTHGFAPAPGCPRCGAALPPAVANGIDSLVSERLGVVTRVNEIPSGFPGIVAALAVGCCTDPLGEKQAVRALNDGIAADTTIASARVRASGESVERYCPAFAPDDLPLSRARDLDGRWLDPRRLAPGEPFDEGAPLRWARATSLADDRPVWVPAAFVYFPYHRAPGEPSLGVQTTCGLALGRTLDEAIQHALEERIERDSLMRAWRFHLPVERVDVRPVPIEGLHLCRLPCESGLEVVVSLLERPEPPYAATGFAARRSLEEAARAATLETVVVDIWLRGWLARGEPPPAYPPRTLSDHPRAHAIRPDLIASRQRWLRPDGVARPRPPAPGWRQVAARLSDACFVELTTPEVARAGLRVVRVVAPDLAPLDCDAVRPRLDGDPTPHPIG
ncbi:YcaO-like family protein [Sorangium sp. So ce1389]|uniref:YcaO-like family protein n=1 Tax=Sorangium sp. So ce1389 TaxID=3133336 RepID=UPI003F5FC1D3